MSHALDQVLTPAQLRSIGEARPRQGVRTQVLALGGRTVVVKWQRPKRFALGYRILSLLAWLARQPSLRGIPPHGGAETQALELKRLRELAGAGVAVPQLLHVATDYLVMSHASGLDLASLLPRDPRLMRQRWNLGLQFVRDVHSRGQYLSQAFARNLIVGAEGIVAIDFEDDPLSVMTLVAAQSRDWLAYLHSTLWMLPRLEPWVMQDLANTLQGEVADLRQCLGDAARRLGWLRHFPKARRPWGRDLISLQALAALLVELEHRTSDLN